MEKQKRELSTKENIRAVTRNNFVLSGKPKYGLGLPDLSTKARKMLYLIIAQDRRSDSGFYEYRVPIEQFAELMEIPRNHAYGIARDVADQLTSLKLEISDGSGGFEFVVAFTTAKYGLADCPNEFVLELNYRMAELFLDIKHELFSQPLLDDLLKMRSKYSIQIWHLMKTQIDACRNKVECRFYLSLAELRKATNTEKKLKQVCDFENRCLKVSIAEIEKICFVDIEYTKRKEGRKVVGFDFIVTNKLRAATEQELPKERVAEIKAKAAKIRGK